MSLTQKEIDKRIPLWTAISQLYVDNEISEYDLELIVKEILKFGCSFEEAEKIFRYEVAPVCWGNIFSWSVWNGFDTEWLTTEIVKNIEKQKRKSLYRVFIRNPLAGSLMTKIVWKDWEKVKAIYEKESK